MDRNITRLKLMTLVCTVINVVLAISGAHADIYRYIDEEGVMHFTNTPTSSTQKYQLFLREKPKITSRYSSKKYDDLISRIKNISQTEYEKDKYEITKEKMKLELLSVY